MAAAGMGAIVGASLIGALSLQAGDLSPLAVILSALAAIGIPSLLVWIWHRPVRGLYILFAGAVYIPAYVNLSSPDAVGKYFPFFVDINSIVHMKVLAVSPAEVLMLLIIVIWILNGIAHRSLTFRQGAVFVPLTLYFAMILFAEFHGLTTGGDFRDSLWEVRAQAYMFIAYLLACNLVRTRGEIHVLSWILVIGAALRGIEGTYRYLFTVRNTGRDVQELFPHEQTFFFNAFIILTLILFLYHGSRRMKRTALLFLPMVIVANLANDRRAGVVAFGVAFVVVLVVTAFAYPARRRVAVGILIGLAIVFPPYYVMFQNKSGTIAMPARAIASNFHPNARDTASNQYRTNENYDILATMKKSPVLGYGFGKRMLVPAPLDNIANTYGFWNLLPHNSILWIWMRLGTIGYIIFWLLIGTAIAKATALVRRHQDPWVKGLALFIAVMVIQEIIFGYLDLQWTNYRNLIVIGVLLALISRLASFPSPAGVSPASFGMPLISKVPKQEISRTLAVVDGRLRR